MNIVSKLKEVQSLLKAPKSKYNTFGKYHYRSTEDILEAVKPLLSERGLLLTVSDEVVLIGDRYYIQATARVADGDNAVIETKAYARESDDKKGMDASQLTGSTSTYARKYALNGLFCIDDTKDADSDEVICVECEKPLPVTIETKNGIVTAVEFSRNFNGCCPDCVKKARKEAQEVSE